MSLDGPIEHEPIPGGWREERLVLEGREFQLLRPAAPDEFLDHLPDDWDQIRGAADPYWATLWPSASALATLVLRETWPAPGKALELGAGIGLVGLAALSSGWDVTFSDHSPHSVALCAENARRNRFVRFRSIQLDWKSPPADRYSLILGSDVLYDRDNHPLLWRVLDRMLAEDGICWIGDPGRYYAGDFLASSADHGFTAELFDAGRHPCDAPVAGEFMLVVLRRTRS